MIALRLHGVGDVRVHDEPAPQAGPGDLALRVSTVGLCGSDLHWYAEGSIGETVLERPLVLGHEFTAVIADGPRAGQRVAVDPADPCGGCAPCRRGDTHLCLAGRFAGHGETDGALRQALAWPERLVHPLPDAIGNDEAALLEPLGVALHAVDLAQIEEARTAGVYGCGPLGLLIVQLLRRRGVEVVATDPLPHRADAATALGAVRAVATRRAGPELLSRDAPVDVAFDVAGDDDALATAIDTVRPGGTVVLVGIPSNDRSAFTASTARRKELTLVVCRRMRADDLPRAIALAERREVELASLVSERFALADGPAAFAALSERKGLKVVVEA